MKRSQKIGLSNEAETIAFGKQLASKLCGNELIYLVGDIGMGKTTLARGLIRALGCQSHVKSPTYTLVEPYDLGDIKLYHFDFYRIENPDELDFIGLDEMLEERAIKLVEWPERASGKLPAADICICITGNQSGRSLEYTTFK